MLLELTLKNFQCIRDPLTLTLVATKDKTLLESNTVPTGLPAAPVVLRSAAIFGPNGSGKSTVLRALQYFQLFVTHSFGIPPGSPTGQVPFGLDLESGSQPGEFEATLLIGGVRYQYGFRLDSQRVHEEWLVVYQSRKGQMWFRRKHNPETNRDEFQFSDKLMGAKKLWQDSTRPNALLLSTAVQLNSAMLLPLFDCVANKMAFFWPDPIDPKYTLSRLGDQGFLAQVVAFLKANDLSISGIQYNPETKRPLFIHRVNNRDFPLELEDESRGTQRLFALAGVLLESLEKGRLLVIDELENSLHPLLLRQLIGMFHDPKINPMGAQLLFATHNTFLLDQQILRRDQIWFMDKDLDQACQIGQLPADQASRSGLKPGWHCLNFQANREAPISRLSAVGHAHPWLDSP